MISLFLDYPETLEEAASDLHPEQFEIGVHQYVVAMMLNYYEDHGTVPTRQVLWDLAAKRLTVEDPYEEIGQAIKRESNYREVPHLRERLSTWIRQRAYDRLYSDEALAESARGNYGFLHNILEQAASIGARTDSILSLPELLEASHSDEWIVEDILVAGQPMIIGGPPKALKTSLACDLAISIAGGRKFLDRYQADQRRVLLISGESGKSALRSTCQSILQSRQIDPDDLGDRLLLDFTLPALSDPGDLARLKSTLSRRKVLVVLPDPLYDFDQVRQ